MVALLKWAGSKRLLVEFLRENFQLEKDCFYVEPFVGGGNSFLDIKGEFAAASDKNPSLIYLWEAVRDDLDELISWYSYYHDSHSDEGYEEARNVYNYLIRDIGKHQLLREKKLDIAGVFLYIMKTCYNGLCRYRKREHFYNVPIGDKLPSVQSVADELLIVNSRIQNTKFHYWDFEETVKHYQSKPRAFFYCDPPYSQIDGKGFQDYIGGWQNSDADRLKKVLVESGCRFAVSEIDCLLVRERYAGYPIIELQANRSIGGNRSKVNEVLILSRL